MGDLNFQSMSVMANRGMGKEDGRVGKNNYKYITRRKHSSDRRDHGEEKGRGSDIATPVVRVRHSSSAGLKLGLDGERRRSRTLVRGRLVEQW